VRGNNKILIGKVLDEPRIQAGVESIPGCIPQFCLVIGFQTDFSEEEKDYTAAEDYFTTTLEQSENEILRQIKTNYEAKLRYASRYAIPPYRFDTIVSSEYILRE